MKFVSNGGQERVIDLLQPGLKPCNKLDVVPLSCSLISFAEIHAEAPKFDQTRLITSHETAEVAPLGTQDSETRTGTHTSTLACLPIQPLDRLPSQGVSRKRGRPPEWHGRARHLNASGLHPLQVSESPLIRFRVHLGEFVNA